MPCPCSRVQFSKIPHHLPEWVRFLLFKCIKKELRCLLFYLTVLNLICWSDDVWLEWECLGILPEEMEGVSRERWKCGCPCPAYDPFEWMDGQKSHIIFKEHTFHHTLSLCNLYNLFLGHLP